MTKQEETILQNYIKDGSTLVEACNCYYKITNSTAALVSIIKLREIIAKMYNKPLNR